MSQTKLLAVDDYTVIDTETTGRDTRWCEIIEVSATRVRDCKPVEKFSTLVCPEKLPIPEFITNLTGITTEMVLTAPRIKDIASTLSAFIGNDILVGQNICFDARFLSVTFEKYTLFDFDNVLIDTMRISRHVNKTLASHKLHCIYDLCVSEGAPVITGNPHRAGFDVEMTRIVYEHMKPKLIALYGEDFWVTAADKQYKKRTIKTEKHEIYQTVEEIDRSNPFFGMRVCFAGKMNLLTRIEAWQCLVNLGGIIEEAVVENLDYLVIGNTSFVSDVKGECNTGKETSKAKANQLENLPFQIVSEDFFMKFAQEVM